MDITRATEQYAAYASPAKHALLQSGVGTIFRCVEAQVRVALSSGELSDPIDNEFIGDMIGPLLNTTSKLIVRPMAYPSAVICLKTAHTMVMLLDTMKVPTDLSDATKEWLKAVKEMKRGLAKWSKLSSVSSSLILFYRTQVELAIMSIPDPNALVKGAKVWYRVEG